MDPLKMYLLLEMVVFQLVQAQVKEKTKGGTSNSEEITAEKFPQQSPFVNFTICEADVPRYLKKMVDENTIH